jgi:hypothetical protein
MGFFFSAFSFLSFGPSFSLLDFVMPLRRPRREVCLIFLGVSKKELNKILFACFCLFRIIYRVRSGIDLLHGDYEIQKTLENKILQCNSFSREFLPASNFRDKKRTKNPIPHMYRKMGAFQRKNAN